MLGTDGEDEGDGFGTEWDEVSSTGIWLTTSVTVTAVNPVITVSIKGTRKWPQHGDGAQVWIDQVTITGPVPTDCICFDRPEPTVPDDDIDANDLVSFEACASGPGIPADPLCD